MQYSGTRLGVRAGMAGLREEIEAELGVPVIDPVDAGVAVAAALLRMGLRSSKANSYSVPRRGRLPGRLCTSSAEPISAPRGVCSGASRSFSSAIRVIHVDCGRHHLGSALQCIPCSVSAASTSARP